MGHAQETKKKRQTFWAQFLQNNSMNFLKQNCLKTIFHFKNNFWDRRIRYKIATIDNVGIRHLSALHSVNLRGQVFHILYSTFHRQAKRGIRHTK